MKKVFLLSVFAAFLVACGNSGETTSTSEAETVAEETAESVSYAVNVAESTLNWKGTKPTGDFHTGTAAITGGKLGMEGESLTSGNFAIDLTKLAVLDEGLDEETKAKLLGHLTSGDFFEVEKYPSASFDITGSTADSLTGNLTIKDVTKSITIPYSVQEENGVLTASSTFAIDRTKWGVTYNSGNFFENLGDYLINDEVEFTVNLVANAK